MPVRFSLRRRTIQAPARSGESKGRYHRTINSFIAQSDARFNLSLATSSIEFLLIDPDVALSVMRSISSAHLSNFYSSGSIGLRRVTTRRSAVYSAAAGIAPWDETQTQGETIQIIIATGADTEIQSCGDMGEGGDLAVGGNVPNVDESAVGRFFLPPCVSDDREAVFPCLCGPILQHPGRNAKYCHSVEQRNYISSVLQ